MLLTNSVSRSQWMVSNLIFAVLGLALIVTVFALVYGYSGGNFSQDILRILASFSGISAGSMDTYWNHCVFVCIVLRLTFLSWVALVLFLVIDLLGEFFDIGQWILNLSPFTQVPKLFAGDTISISLGLIFIVAVVLMFVGLWGYRRRDIFS